MQQDKQTNSKLKYGGEGIYKANSPFQALRLGQHVHLNVKLCCGIII
jgi:hypothetical protein